MITIYIEILVLLITIIPHSIISITCNTAFECVGQSVSNINGPIESNGYKSLYGPITTITTETEYWSSVSCSGAFSCANSSLFLLGGSKAYCEGTYSCAYIDGVGERNYDNRVFCGGVNSCSHFSMNGSYIVCNGALSCSYSTFRSNWHFETDGAYSLYKSSIFTTSNTYIYIRGYQAGFGAKIYCLTGSNCNIYCYGNSCHMLYVECNGNCEIHSNSPYTIMPLTNYSDYDESQLDSYLFNVSQAMDNEKACNTQSTDLVFDDYDEDTNITDDFEGVICSRAKWSFKYYTMISNVTNKSVVCSGEESCKDFDGTINNMFCEGTGSCMYAKIISTQNVYCGGMYGCVSAEIFYPQNLYCFGRGSCKHATITTNGNISIYLLGMHSGYKTSIYCNAGDHCFVLCGAHGSCDQITTLQCDGKCTVRCDLDTGCPPGFTFEPTTSFPTIAATVAQIDGVVEDPYAVDSESVEILLHGSLLWIVIIVGALDFLLMICCIYYIFTKLLNRTKEPHNTSWRAAMKQFKCMEYVGIVLEIFDIVSDYIFATGLIMGPYAGYFCLHALGWISLVVAILGVVLFLCKYLLLRKLLGVQIKRYREELKQTHIEEERNKIMEEIRTRRMDIDVLSLFNSSIEDIPQTMIVLIYLTSIGFSYQSILNISMSILSFIMKLFAIFMTKFGCKDDDDGMEFTKINISDRSYSVYK